MFAHYFCLDRTDCPPNWVLDGCYCYFYINTLATWQESLDQCKSLAGPSFPDANLLSLHSDDELAFVQGKHKFHTFFLLFDV